MWWHSLMAGPSFRSIHSCTVGRFSSNSACPSISYVNNHSHIDAVSRVSFTSTAQRPWVFFLFGTVDTTRADSALITGYCCFHVTWSRKIRARGAQSVVRMKRTTSVTLHSNGLVSKHNFWGGSVFEVYKHADKQESHRRQAAYFNPLVRCWVVVEIPAPTTLWSFVQHLLRAWVIITKIITLFVLQLS